MQSTNHNSLAISLSSKSNTQISNFLGDLGLKV